MLSRFGRSSEWHSSSGGWRGGELTVGPQPRQLRPDNLPPPAALHHNVHIHIANRESLSVLLDHIVLRPVNDGHVIAQDSNAPPGRNHRHKSNRSRPEPPDYIGLGGNVPRIRHTGYSHRQRCATVPPRRPRSAPDPHPQTAARFPVPRSTYQFPSIASRVVILSEVAAREANGHAVEESLPQNSPASVEASARANLAANHALVYKQSTSRRIPCAMF